jgi:site-specific recombinase XerD
MASTDDVRKVTERDCEWWLGRYQHQYAPSVVNNAIATLRGIFQEAINTGARFNNPAAGLSRVKIRQKRLELPSREELLKFVDAIRTAGARRSKSCVLSCVQRTATRRSKAWYMGRREFCASPIARARRPSNRHQKWRSALCSDDSRAGTDAE